MYLNETGVVDGITKYLTGKATRELDEFHHRTLLTNTPSKKQRLIEDIEDSITSCDKHLSKSTDPMKINHLKAHQMELKMILNKVKNIHFDYAPIDHDMNTESSDMSAGLSAVPSGTLFAKNYAAGGKVQSSFEAPVAIAGTPHEPSLPLDSLSGKELITVKQAADDNALDKMYDSLKQRANIVASNADRDKMMAEARVKMIDAEKLIKSAKSFTNAERPKLVSSLHKFIDQMKSIEEKLSAANPDQTKSQLEARKLTEAVFGNRKFNRYKKDFATNLVHNKIAGMALEGGFEAQKLKWYNLCNGISCNADKEKFLKDSQKAIDTIGSVSQETEYVDDPDNNAKKADAVDKDHIKASIIEQIGYIEGLQKIAREKIFEV
jgi:hypothetical protein